MAGMLGLAALFVTGACTRSVEEESRSVSIAPETRVENSGRKVTGIFSIVRTADPYLSDQRMARRQRRITFQNDGSFKRETLIENRVTTVEEGAYVIGTQGEFVLYIERVQGEWLTSARSELYTIIQEAGDNFKLKSSSDVVTLSASAR